MEYFGVGQRPGSTGDWGRALAGGRWWRWRRGCGKQVEAWARGVVRRAIGRGGGWVGRTMAVTSSESGGRLSRVCL